MDWFIRLIYRNLNIKIQYKLHFTVSTRLTNGALELNSELYELLNDMDVVQRINIQRLGLLGHVVRMEEDAPARRVFDAGICGSRRRGRP